MLTAKENPVRATEPAAPAPQRKRIPPRRGRSGGGKPRRSALLTALMTLPLLYSLMPLVWLAINSTKSRDQLFSTFGLWFGDAMVDWYLDEFMASS